MEDVIKNNLIPALIGRQVSTTERRLLALPTRYGGLGIQNPTQTADIEYNASTFITEELTNLIYHQSQTVSDLKVDAIRKKKSFMESEKNKRFQMELDDILVQVDPLTARSIQTAKQKGASAWLVALPIKKLGYVLNKQEFRDDLCLRYNWHVPDIPKFCGCGKKCDIVHILTCKKGGYVSLRHNSLRDAIANIMREVCTDVQTEPLLLPTDPNNFTSRSNTANEARLDISARGVYSTFERTFFDVRVAHPFAVSNVDMPLDKV